MLLALPKRERDVLCTCFVELYQGSFTLYFT